MVRDCTQNDAPSLGVHRQEHVGSYQTPHLPSRGKNSKPHRLHMAGSHMGSKFSSRVTEEGSQCWQSHDNRDRGPASFPFSGPHLAVGGKQEDARQPARSPLGPLARKHWRLQARLHRPAAAWPAATHIGFHRAHSCRAICSTAGSPGPCALSEWPLPALRGLEVESLGHAQLP